MKKPWRSRYATRISDSLARSDDHRKRLFPYVSVDTERYPVLPPQRPSAQPTTKRVWYPLPATRKAIAKPSGAAAYNIESVEQLHERMKTVSRSYNTLADALEKANTGIDSKLP
jgi:hypothetical protein